MSVEQINNVHQDANRWTNDEVFQLIEIVNECGAIYNSLDRNYFCRPYVENLWRQIDIRLGKRPGVSLSKWTNLRISFRREYQLLIRNKAKPSWIFFSKMMFLQPFLRKKRLHNTKLESHIQEALEQISSITRGNFKNYVANIEQFNNEASTTDENLDEEISWNRDSSIKEEESIEVDDCLADDPDQGCDECIEEVDDDVHHYELPHTSKEDGKVYVTDSNKTSDRTSPENEEHVRTLLKRKQDCASSSTTKRHYVGAGNSPNQNDTIQTISLNTSCECKSNPDAMFLMSLMPDIEMLSRKDKGIFKIEVQRLIQNILYPDE